MRAIAAHAAGRRFTHANATHTRDPKVCTERPTAFYTACPQRATRGLSAARITPAQRSAFGGAAWPRCSRRTTWHVPTCRQHLALRCAALRQEGDEYASKLIDLLVAPAAMGRSAQCSVR